VSVCIKECHKQFRIDAVNGVLLTSQMVDAVHIDAIVLYTMTEGFNRQPVQQSSFLYKRGVDGTRRFRPNEDATKTLGYPKLKELMRHEEGQEAVDYCQQRPSLREKKFLDYGTYPLTNEESEIWSVPAVRCHTCLGVTPEGGTERVSCGVDVGIMITVARTAPTPDTRRTQAAGQAAAAAEPSGLTPEGEVPYTLRPTEDEYLKSMLEHNNALLQELATNERAYVGKSDEDHTCRPCA
jgi:hypothetical protein